MRTPSLLYYLWNKVDVVPYLQSKLQCATNIPAVSSNRRTKRGNLDTLFERNNRTLHSYECKYFLKRDHNFIH